MKHGPFATYKEITVETGTFGIPAGMIFDDKTRTMVEAPEGVPLIVEDAIPEIDLPEADTSTATPETVDVADDTIPNVELPE